VKMEVKLSGRSAANETKNAPKTMIDSLGSELAAVTKCPTITDIIGQYGFYQLSLTLFAFIRYVCVAMMTNTGPLIAPSIDYSCQVPTSIAGLVLNPQNSTLDRLVRGKCEIMLINGSSYECSSWSYNTSLSGITLTDSFDLVCGRDWLRSAFQSIVSVGVVVASVVWGSISDRYGRSTAMRASFVCSLVAGSLSYSTTSYAVFAASRSLCSFADLGLVVSTTTIIVESLGSKYRGAVCIIVYTGWAFGVMIMPWLTEIFKDYRQLMLFTVAAHLFTLPWLLTIRESARWLLVNEKIDEAGEELRRINKWNCKSDKISTEIAESRFKQLKTKYEKVAEKKRIAREEEGGSCYGVGQLFKSRELIVTTATLIWTTFTCELLYMLFIMINSDIGESVKLNYAIGGAMETLATIISIVMISRMTRKFSLVLTLISISTLCFLLAITHEMPSISVWILNLSKLSISTLSSLVYVVTTEIFPTNLRQTGFGLSGTIGSLGAVVAPFVRKELVDLIGMTRVMLMLVALTLTAAICIPFYLRETKGLELTDDVDELELNNLRPEFTKSAVQSDNLV